MWDLNLTKIDGGNCYDSMIYLLLDQFSSHAPLMYLSNYSLLDVEHQTEESLKRILRVMPDNEAATELFGLQTEYISSSEADIRQIISNEIDKSPIGIYLDPFYCDWTPLFQKTHYAHFILVLSVDKITGSCVCVDLYYPTSGLIHISLEKLAKISDYIVVFTFKKKSPPSAKEACSFLIRNLPMIDVDSYEDQKLKSIRFFTEELAAADIGPQKNIDASLLLIKLIFLGEDKRIFLQGLQCLDQMLKTQIFDPLYPLLKKIVEKYAILRSLLIKYVLIGIVKKSDLQVIVNDIFELDLNAISLLNDILKNNMAIMTVK